MDRQKDRTIEVYKCAGAKMRIVKQLGAVLLRDMQGMVSDKDYEKVKNALGKINQVSAYASTHMFVDFPDLDKQYDNVFYGNVTDEPNSPVDAEQIALAKEIVKSIF